MAAPGPTGARRPSRPHALYRWHRRAGIAAAAFLLFLVATGLPLQFTAALDLGGRHVGSALILDWYGLEAPRSVETSGGLVSVGEAVFVAGGRYLGDLAELRGAVRLESLTVAAGRREVLLVEPASATVVDRLPMAAGIRRIGRWQGRIVLDTDAGTRLSDADLVNWQATPVPPAEVAWAKPVPADAAVAEPLRRAFRGRMLSVERLLQDLHSGRLFGTPGIVAVDVATLLLTFLAFSGIVMWWRTPGR